MAPRAKRKQENAPAGEVVRGRGSPRITVRLSQAEQDWLNEMEARHGVSAADVVRVGFAMIVGTAAKKNLNAGAFVAAAIEHSKSAA